MSTPEAKKVESASKPAAARKPETPSWVKLSNFNRARTGLVAIVSSNAEMGWIFLKNAQDEILCSIQHDNDEDFQAEITSINEQLG
jgi:hypothetical protein